MEEGESAPSGGRFRFFHASGHAGDAMLHTLDLLQEFLFAGAWVVELPVPDA